MRDTIACAARRGPKEFDPTPPPASGINQDQLYSTAFYFDENDMRKLAYRLMRNRPSSGRPEGVPAVGGRGRDRDLLPLPPPDGRRDGFRRFASKSDFAAHANSLLYPGKAFELTDGNSEKLWLLNNFLADMREQGIIEGAGSSSVYPSCSTSPHATCGECSRALRALTNGALYLLQIFRRSLAANRWTRSPSLGSSRSWCSSQPFIERS